MRIVISLKFDQILQINTIIIVMSKIKLRQQKIYESVETHLKALSRAEQSLRD